MLKPDEIRKKLEDCNMVAVSKSSGVGYKVLYRFIKGADSKFSVIERLSKYLESKND